MTTIRSVTVREDRDGKLFIKYKPPFYEEYLIVRPGVPECWGGQKNIFKKGDKVKVQQWNPAMGFFLVRKADKSGDEVWQGPHYDRSVNHGSWVGEKLKKV